MRSLYLASIVAVLAGCSASSGNNVFGTGAAGGGGAGGTSASSGSGGTASISSSGAGGDINLGDAGTGGSTPLIAEVFAHGPETLYKLDPDTKVVSIVGPFSGCDSSVIDIALDKDGLMFGTTFGGLYRIEKTSAACTFISSGSYPNSLSFVPVGTLDPNKEALVGYNGSQYVRIDTVTGAITNIGQVGGGYSSSGDIVSVIGGGTYLTVNGTSCNDCLIEVNPTTGAFVKKIGAVGHAGVFGLAFWGGVAYGFDSDGALFEINLTTGATTDIPTGMGGLVFWGAGSTTAAPLKPPT